MTFRIPTLLALLAAALVVVGCGGGKSDDEQVREIVQQLAASDPAVCDKSTSKFLDNLGGSVAKCKKEAEDSNDKETAKIKKVTIDGDKATVEADIGGEPGAARLVKDGDDWKIDSVAAGGSASGGGSTKTTASADGDEVAARGTADAFLQGVRDEDEAVVCGLLSEKLAREAFKVQRFGVAECVEKLKNYDWTKLQGTLEGVKVESLDTSGTGKGAGAGVQLSKGILLGMKNLGDRWVITTIK